MDKMGRISTTITGGSTGVGPRDCHDVPAGVMPRRRHSLRVARIGGWLLAVAVGLARAAPTSAISILKAFPGDPSDGRDSAAALISDGAGNFYGTTYYGGPSDVGTVFKVRNDGTGFALLYSFAGGSSDGANPYAGLIFDGAGNLYGTTHEGGASNDGTVFRVKTDGTGFTVLHSFAGGASDGAYPYAGLILDGADNLYGTTNSGGASDKGTVFKVKTDGTGFTVLHSFAGGSSDGANPYAGLILDGAANLYGTTYYGGASGYGTVFKVKTDGSAFAILHGFTWGPADGVNPYAGLLLDNASNLYGTTHEGGASNDGTVFKVKTNGTGFAVLHGFTGAVDGARPAASLILDSAGNLYGTTFTGGASDNGAVFKVKSDGSGFAVLHSFAWAASDGANPEAALILDSAGNLYGTTQYGGPSNDGTVFKVKTDGTNFAILHGFTWAPAEGAYPDAHLILDGAGNLYGTTKHGGASDNGTVFKVKTDGTGFAVLHSFAGTTLGAGPEGSLILDSAGDLYGTTSRGGASDDGTVFKVNTDGTTLSILHSFAGGASDGAFPHAGLILDGAGNLYGTTVVGGASGNGTVFKVRTDGTGFAVLHGFTGALDGAGPEGSLILDGAGNIYGTTYYGGASDDGTIFKVKTDGTGFGVLHRFAGGFSDGASPFAGLVLDGAGSLYGTTNSGGLSDKGTVFKVKTDGTGFAILHSFAGGASDGAFPYAGVALDGAGNVYGTTYFGGASDDGTVFKVKTDGSGSTLLHSFVGGASDGVYSYAGVILDSAGNLYGTTEQGGAWDLGTVFALPFTVSSLAITTTSPLPAGTVGAAYSQQFVATGGTGGYSWSLTSGSPPGNVALSSSGVLAGTPAAGGDFSFAVTVTDSADNTAQGTFALHVGACTSPSITFQPQSQSIGSGQTATLSVTATGTTPLSYQWYQGSSGTTSNPVGTNASGLTTSTLTATTSFWVRVTNACGQADSAAATVTVGAGPPTTSFVQEGPKLVGTGAMGSAFQGSSVALSSDGNTAIVGGPRDTFIHPGDYAAGAAWVFTRTGVVWTQQGPKLVGAGAVGDAAQGWSVAISADGNTAIVGGLNDNDGVGAAWVFTRTGAVWTQQGSKLVGTGAIGPAAEGGSVALSADGNTAIVGGSKDNGGSGAAWVFTRSGGEWTQQGSKLVGIGSTATAQQGFSVSLSGDGNSVIFGGPWDSDNAGAAWVFTRSGGEWTQQGSKLVGTGANRGTHDRGAYQGVSAALSGDGYTAIIGGHGDNDFAGAAWVFTFSSGVWTQQGSKLVGAGAVGTPELGVSVALSGDGNMAIVGGFGDNFSMGAAWVFTRSGGVWTQQGAKLVGTGAAEGWSQQGFSVDLSADGTTAIVGGRGDGEMNGAAWVYTSAGGVSNVVWVPVASHNPGKNNSQWRSDLCVLNTAPATANVQLKFFGSGGVATNTTNVSAGTQLILTDVVGRLGVINDSGAIEILSDQPLKVTARSYNLVSSAANCYANGTQGQDYPAVVASSGLSALQSAYLAGLTENAQYHTNVGLLNTGTVSTTVLVDLYDGTGTGLHSYPVSLPAGRWAQVTQPFLNYAGQTAMDRGYARLTVQTGSGVFGFASVVDNITNDPTTVAMQRWETSFYGGVPVASHNPGKNNSQWRSDLGLLNPGTAEVDLGIRFHGSSGDVNASRSVPAGAQLILTDVIGQLGGSGSGALQIISGLPLQVTARTYNQVSSDATCYPNGTQGQDYPLVWAPEGISIRQSAYLAGLTENAQYHTNIGLVSLIPATVLVELYDGDGTKLARYTVSLQGSQWVQATQPFLSYAGQTAMDSGYAKITVQAGQWVFGFASVVDNITNDPTTVAMQQ
ncbi:MAG: hypothetical protein LAO05_00460 [Acidobacteriia bacterium]|nr:hypothetical protein [Terriglobia bacterium]